MAVPWGALIGAGSNLIGGLLGKAEDDDNRDLQRHQFDQTMDHSVRRRVEDAKRAGIHPLYALGMQGISPAPFSTGGALGKAVGRAGETVERYMSRRSARKAAAPLAAAQIRSLDAQATRSLAEAQLAQSRAKTMEGRANSEQDKLKLEGGIAPDGTRLFPSAERRTVTGTPLAKRPVVEKPLTNMPMWSTSVNERGKPVRVLNPELGLDEVSQVVWVFDQMYRVPIRWYKAWKRTTQPFNKFMRVQAARAFANRRRTSYSRRFGYAR